MNKNIDIIDRIFSMPFIDSFHNYQDAFSNIRFYHMLKASVVRDFILNNKDVEKNILDAGAGRGPYSMIAKDFFKKVYCYEYSQLELAVARDNIGASENIEYAAVDLTNIPLAAESVDVIICSEVLEHIPDYNKAATELYRVLKPSGRVLLSMPNSHSLFYSKVKKNNLVLLSKNSSELNHNEWEFIRHLQFDSVSIDNIALQAGFRILNRQGVNVIPLPEYIRKMLMNKVPVIFRAFVFISKFLGKLAPRFGSFYFLELKK